jgi:hypothetical protein
VHRQLATEDQLTLPLEACKKKEDPTLGNITIQAFLSLQYLFNVSLKDKNFGH